MTKTTRATLLVSLVLAMLALAPAAMAAPSLRQAPPVPAFRHDLVAGAAYIHDPVMVRGSSGALPLLRVGTLPSAYDLRPLNRLTPVRDQGSTGTCWAFATLAALESSLMPAHAWDFSEDNMVNRNGFTVANRYQDGGNLQMAEAYLARWGGPLDETADPLQSGVIPSGPVRKHVQGFVLLPPRADFAMDPTANDAIKQAVMNYGAVATQMYFPDSDRGAEYNATLGFYQASVPASAAGVPEVNHGVAIVGWDDDYPSTQFVTAPPGNGAFLVRNSWSTDFGDGGYFWISYYDAALARSDMSLAFTRVDGMGKYTRTYGYDQLGWTSSAGVGSTTARFANRFTAKARERSPP